jgi:hypothetical protein
MAMTLTNRALFVVNPTMWNVPADIGVGLLAGASVPGALTVAAIQDVNFVSDLLALTGVDEPTDGSYARVNPLTLGTAAEDDTNNRVNYPSGDADFGALDNEQIYAAFIYIDGGSDAARVVIGVDILASVATTNGAGTVYDVPTDLLRTQHG